jgi:hypothetical protein
MGGFLMRLIWTPRRIDMGWNEGYQLLEETVIRVYDLGKLDEPMVEALLEPYRGSDIDSGGSRDLRTKDGKSMKEVVCEAWGIQLPPRPPLGVDDPEGDTYGAAVYEGFRAIEKEFGFW